MKRLITAVLLLIVSTSLYANDVDNFVEVGADVVVYDDFAEVSDLDTSLALNVRVGTFMNTGLYAWGSYEQPNVKAVGIDSGDLRTWGVGGGYRLGFAENWYALAEVGYYIPSSSSDLKPVEFDDDWGGSIGVGYDINENFTLNAKYRYLELDYDGPTACAGGCPSFKGDMSSIGVGLSYRF